MEKKVPVDEGAEAFIELLNANGVDYMFLNPGTDTFPIQEAISKFKALGKPAPKVMLCLHESVALAAAHGYFAVTGKPQVALVHVDIGTQQVGGALHNAQRGRAGIILCAGRSPSTYEQDIRGERSAGIHWIQEQYDQAGIVRNYVKWEYELRSTANMHQVMQRAFQVASTEPCGPVYLTLPRELLMERMESVTIPEVEKHSAAVTPEADTVELIKIADTLLQAESPLIVSGDTGRRPENVALLVELAEGLGARVIPDNVRMSFPNTHPLCVSGFGQSYFQDADAILLIDKDVPYIPGRTKLREDARIMHISIDPIKRDIPLWLFPGDAFVQADAGKALSALNRIIGQKITPEQKTRFQSRAEQIGKENKEARERQRTSALEKAGQIPIAQEYLRYCVGEVIDEDTIIVQEMGRTVPRSKPGTLYDSGGSSLGFGMGGALGIKLASPDKTVVSMEGDGCLIFGEPIATLWAAGVYKAPFMTVVFNNRRYDAPRGPLGILGAYGEESYSARTGVWEGIDIVPSPDYALIAQACGAWGRKVEDPAELITVLKEGLEQVRQGRPALVDVRIK
jgi:acetolactate synthase-1/2/3 large subunit